MSLVLTSVSGLSVAFAINNELMIELYQGILNVDDFSAKRKELCNKFSLFVGPNKFLDDLVDDDQAQNNKKIVDREDFPKCFNFCNGISWNDDIVSDDRSFLTIPKEANFDGCISEVIKKLRNRPNISHTTLFIYWTQVILPGLSFIIVMGYLISKVDWN